MTAPTDGVSVYRFVPTGSLVSNMMAHTHGFVPRVADPNSFDLLLRRFRNKREPIAVNFRELVQWRSYPERATHLVHPYPAKLLAHIPFYFLAQERLAPSSCTVLDPFCGSGTVPLESILAGKNAVAADANPFARLLTFVKTYRYDTKALTLAKQSVVEAVPEHSSIAPPDVVNLEYWFHPRVLSQLERLREAILLIPKGPERSFLAICFSSCMRRVSLADPRLAVPVRERLDNHSASHRLHALVKKRQQQLRTVDVFAQFVAIVDQNIERVAATERVRPSDACVTSIFDDARTLSSPPDTSALTNTVSCPLIDLVVTSPPYAGAQKYVRASSLSLGWLGLCSSDELRDIERKNIGREHYAKAEYANGESSGVIEADQLLAKIRHRNPLRAHIARQYLCEMRHALSQVKRVLAPNGHVVLVAGANRVCGYEFMTPNYLAQIAEDIGLRPILVLTDDIRSRGLMTKRNRTAGTIAQEWVYVFERDS